jgi:hypothetical protein
MASTIQGTQKMRQVLLIGVFILGMSNLQESICGQVVEKTAQDRAADAKRRLGEDYDLQFTFSALAEIAKSTELANEFEFTEAQSIAMTELRTAYATETQLEITTKQSEIARLESESKSEEASRLRDELEKNLAGIRKKSRKHLEELLLPHQLERLSQLAIRRQMRLESGGKNTIAVLAYAIKSLANDDGSNAKTLSELEQLEEDYKAEVVKLNQKYEERIRKLVPGKVLQQIEDRIGPLAGLTR